MTTHTHRAWPLTSIRAITLGCAVAVAFAACGSETSSSEEGCEPQKTRECVGPGACKGGQVCGADRKWGACDCGSAGSGGTAAAGGSGASGGGGATGGGGTGATSSGGTGAISGGTGGISGGGGTPSGGGTAGDASSGGSTADASDAAADTGLGPNDDPCPTDPINVNCSSSCGPKSQGCSSACYDWSSVSDKVAAAHYVVRTPSSPGPFAGNICKCGGDAGVQAAYWMQIWFEGVSGGNYKITAGKPWKVWAKNDALGTGIGTCLDDVHYAKGCDVTGYPTSPATFTFWVGTDDPNAPARNVLIQKTSAACAASDFWQ